MKTFWNLPSLVGRCGDRAADVVATRRDAAKLAGRSVKIGCLVSLTGKGAEWGQAAKLSMEIAVEEINAKGGIGGMPIELDLLRHADPGSRGAQDRSAGWSSATRCWRFQARASAREFETIAPQLDSRLKTVINSYCSAKPGPFRHEQMGVPQHADQRQAAQAGGRCLDQGIQDQEGRHHL